MLIADFFFFFAELSLTVPITNSLAFLFTVLGEWYAEGKVISRGKFGFGLWVFIVHVGGKDADADGFY